MARHFITRITHKHVFHACSSHECVFAFYLYRNKIILCYKTN